MTTHADAESVAHLVVEAFSPNDRAAAVMAGLAVEREVRHLLRSYLVSNRALLDRLFRSDAGPLGRLASQIDMAFALGIIPAVMYRDLHLIRKMRNHCAHELRPHLGAPPLQGWLKPRNHSW